MASEMTLDLEYLKRLAKTLDTQDNLATAHPIFVVQETDRIYGLDSDYAEDFEEIDREDYIESVGYRDVWKWVQPFLTREAAQEYIDCNHHNLNNPRIWVASAYRNKEWQMIRSLIPQTVEALEAAQDTLLHVTDYIYKRETNEQMASLGGPLMEAMVQAMIDWFVESGGKNYVECGIDYKGDSYVLNMSKKGGKTPVDIAHELRQENLQLREELARLKGTEPDCSTDCACKE